jgi:hypothetical protein
MGALFLFAALFLGLLQTVGGWSLGRCAGLRTEGAGHDNNLGWTLKGI